jgi:hypothetical protein
MATDFPRLAFLTPCQARDLERCRLLAESIARYVPGTYQHWVLVPQREVTKVSFASARTHVAAQEDVLPFWLRPLKSGWWLSLRSAPVRGSVVANLVALDPPKEIDADAFAWLDPRCFFVQPFDPLAAHCRDGQLLLFREEGRAEDGAAHRAVARVLATPPRPRAYDSLIVYLRRPVLRALHQHLEGVHGTDWRVPLLRLGAIDLPLLHGAFCDDVLGEAAGLYRDDRLFARCRWGTVPFGAEGLRSGGEAPRSPLQLKRDRAGAPPLESEELFGP